MDKGVCPVPEDSAPGQGAKEVFTAVKFRHLDIGVTYRLKGVGITTGASRNAILPGKALCSG